MSTDIITIAKQKLPNCYQWYFLSLINNVAEFENQYGHIARVNVQGVVTND